METSKGTLNVNDKRIHLLNEAQVGLMFAIVQWK